MTQAVIVQYPSLPPKSTGAAYAFMLFTFIGFCGIQHFYLGKYLRGVIWLLTAGLFGVGLIIDLFTLPSQTRHINELRARGITN